MCRAYKRKSDDFTRQREGAGQERVEHIWMNIFLSGQVFFCFLLWLTSKDFTHQRETA